MSVVRPELLHLFDRVEGMLHLADRIVNGAPPARAKLRRKTRTKAKRRKPIVVTGKVVR